VLMMPTGNANVVIQLAELFADVDPLGTPGGRSGRIGLSPKTAARVLQKVR
jgi:hypothetical protein